MEKNVCSKHSRRHSTGNFFLELNGYEDVASRYLSGPLPSCHNNCKPHIDHLTEPKSTTVGQRSNNTHVDSVKGIRKHNTPIPKSPTKHAKITNTSLVKHQVKTQPIESKRHDFKTKSSIKSKSEEADPFYIPSSRITWRYSDIVTHTSGLEDVLDSLDVGLTRNCKKNDKKIEPRKDLKSFKSGVKTARNGTINKKVQTSKSHNNQTKPTKPVVEVVQEQTNQTQSLDEAKVLENSQDGAQMASKSKKAENPPSDAQNNGSVAASGVKKTEETTRVGKLVKENENSSSQELKFRQGKITDTPESGGPRKLKFGQGKITGRSEGKGPSKLKFTQGKVLDGDKIGQKSSISLRRLSSDGLLPSPESNSIDVTLKQCDQEAKKGQMRVNNLIEEAASKLIQTRKSKVQALVGAFEMISTNDF